MRTPTTDTPDYPAPAKWLHWIIAACVIFIIPAGVLMGRLPEGALQNNLFNAHRSFGMLVFVLALARVGVRLTYGAPPPYADLTKFERIASTAAHHLLYVLIVVTPLFGWLWMSTYRIEQVPMFGLFNLPPILPQNDALASFFARAHMLCGLTMAATLFAHAGGALMHAVIKRDGVLHRMLPRAWWATVSRLQGRA